MRGAFAAALIVTALLGDHARAQEPASQEAQGTQRTQESASCAPETIGVVTVRAVLDGRTLLLTDGREVRLAGIEVSPESKPALEAHIAGLKITLKGKTTDQTTDRYGRLVAYAYAGSGPSVQAQLLSKGRARVAARIGEKIGEPGCAAALFAAETAARTARLGLWGEPHYLPRKAGNPAEILGERGRFTLVEGRVL